MEFGADIEVRASFSFGRGMRSGVGPPFDKVSVGCFAVLLLFNMSRMKNGSMWDSWGRRGSFA